MEHVNEVDEKLMFYSKAQVSQKLGMAPSTIYRLVKDGDFPAPVSISKRRVGWVPAEIDEWLTRKIKERDV
jgi:prophage regulatory protein